MAAHSTRLAALSITDEGIMRHDGILQSAGARAMLKEVGASGQISLGKRLAGQLFDVIFHPDGRVDMLPMRAVAMVPEQAPAFGTLPDGWRPPGGYEACSQWAADNRGALEAYAGAIEQHGTAAEQLQRFLSEPPETAAA